MKGEDAEEGICCVCFSGHAANSCMTVIDQMGCYPMLNEIRLAHLGRLFCRMGNHVTATEVETLGKGGEYGNF